MIERNKELGNITLDSGTIKPEDYGRTVGLQDLSAMAERRAAGIPNIPPATNEEYVFNATNQPRAAVQQPVEPVEEEFVMDARQPSTAPQEPNYVVPDFLRTGIDQEEIQSRIDPESGKYISKYNVDESNIRPDGRIMSPEEEVFASMDKAMMRKKQEMNEYFTRMDEDAELDAALLGGEATDPTQEPKSEVSEEFEEDAVEEAVSEDKDMADFERELQEELEDSIPEVYIPTRPEPTTEGVKNAENIADDLLSHIPDAYNEPLFKPEAPKTKEQVEDRIRPTVQEVSYTPPTKMTSVLDDADFADLDDEATEKELEEFGETEGMKRLRREINEKIQPIANPVDLRNMRIIKDKTPVTTSMALQHRQPESVINWVLYNGKRSIKMRRFSGKDMERLTDALDNRVLSMANVRDAYSLIWEHDMSPNKPASLEAWMKVTPFTDDDHLFMAAYVATFASSNFVPYSCRSGKIVNEKKCENMWLSDNTPIMDMVKFKSPAVRGEFEGILHSEANYSADFYQTQLFQISDSYVIGTKLPSLFDVHMEPASMSLEDRQKFAPYLGLVQYIDAIYLITEEGLREIEPKAYPNNMAKNLKSKIFTYGKIIDTLTEDQYSILYASISEMIKDTDEVTYRLPASTCDHCGTVIEEEERSAKELLFTRHQLTPLRTI